MLVFEERGKPEYPEKNLSEQGLVLHFALEKLLHFALNTLLHFASMLLHFAA